jgi:hypothetical protein
MLIDVSGLNCDWRSRFIVIEPIDAVPGQSASLAGTLLSHSSFNGRQVTGTDILCRTFRASLAGLPDECFPGHELRLIQTGNLDSSGAESGAFYGGRGFGSGDICDKYLGRCRIPVLELHGISF